MNCIWFKSLDCGAHHNYYTITDLPATLTLWRPTTHIGVSNSVSKFGGILFSPIWNTAVFLYAAGPLKSRFLSVTRMDPLYLLNPSKNTVSYTSTHSNCVEVWATNSVGDTAMPCLSVAWQGVAWVEIWTLAYVTNSSCCPERFSVAYCTHIIQTKLMLKNRRYPQKSMFTVTVWPTDMPVVVLG